VSYDPIPLAVILHQWYVIKENKEFLRLVQKSKKAQQFCQYCMSVKRELEVPVSNVRVIVWRKI